MKVYAVTELCDYEYGNTEIKHIFATEEAAIKYIDSKEDCNEIITLGCMYGCPVFRYDIEEYEIEE